MTLRFTCFALTLALLMPLPAAAQTKGPNESCELVETPDGFVALRDGPNAQAKVIVKMDPKGAIIPRTDRARYRRGSWMLVNYWAPGTEFEDALKKGPVGWMNERLQQGCG